MKDIEKAEDTVEETQVVSLSPGDICYVIHPDGEIEEYLMADGGYEAGFFQIRGVSKVAGWLVDMVEDFFNSATDAFEDN